MITLSVGSRVVIINEADPHYGQRGVIADIDTDPDSRTLLGIRFSGADRLQAFWPSELRPVSAVDQLSEIA